MNMFKNSSMYVITIITEAHPPQTMSLFQDRCQGQETKANHLGFASGAWKEHHGKPTAVDHVTPLGLHEVRVWLLKVN